MSEQLSEERVHQIARALADPRRLDLLKRIGQAGDSLSCEAIRSCCTVSAPTVSHHMKELETAGLVEVEREGKFVTYHLRREVLEAYRASLASI